MPLRKARKVHGESLLQWKAGICGASTAPSAHYLSGGSNLAVAAAKPLVLQFYFCFICCNTDFSRLLYDAASILESH